MPKSFARNAKKIVVDIDKYELEKKRGLKIDLKINLDIKAFLQNYIKYKKDIVSRNEWMLKTNEWKKKYPIILKEFFKEKKSVNPYVFMDKLSKLLNSKDVIIGDTGAHLTWLVQAIKIKLGQKLFSAFGNSPMGYALPASIGASMVRDKKRVICIAGDGSIQFNLQELHTVDKLKLPVKIFIFNNNGYGIIKQFQELYLNKRYEATGTGRGVSNPNFKKISRAFNINYNLIKNHNQLKNLDKIINSKNAEIIEVNIKDNQKIIPKLQFGNPIEDLSPLLARKEFYKNMDISLVKKDKKIFEAN